MVDPKSYVEGIQQEIDDSRSSRLWDDAIHMLVTVSESIFSRSAHFILELLQNAEDACSRIQNNRGEIEFFISPERVRISHNGAPFEDADVNAICGVRSSKKPEEGTLGYLGIGFKSVFKVTECPEVHSSGFHFKFDKSACKNPSDEPWQIRPIWVHQAPEPINDTLTTFIFPFRSSEAYQQTLEELRKLDVHIFLFLRWLKKLTFNDEVRNKTRVIENLGEKDKIISVRRDGTIRRFAVFRHSAFVLPEVAGDPALEFYKRQKVKQREVVLAFGIDAQGNLEQIEEASTLGSVSSFLPLIEERSGAKFLIQSDFLVQPGREAIQHELCWNRWLVSEAAELAKNAIDEFKKHPQWKSQYLSVFDFTSLQGEAFEKLFKPYLHEPVASYVESAETYPTPSGHIKPEKAVLLHEKLAGLITDADLPALFGGIKDLHLADPALDVKKVPSYIQKKVNVADLGRVARNEVLLKSKANQQDSTQWFVKLYSAMAESGDYFKEEKGRTHKGTYYSYDSPIYVLTDKGVIVSAKQAHLGSIPKEVQQLRQKFPEVDSLLSSYQFIHPKLESPELSKFFREHTHVQSIDYDKICREVFQPKIFVTSPPLPKDELIAYTRLIQKGPHVPLNIWVATKSGNFRPSNQVFFGTEYSPSEDWEKYSKYSPQMDFLSAEYIQNVPKDQVLPWKQFFANVGVKEQADNPYVETFAMAFVEDNMKSELKDFIPKNRQQHGCDREAKRISDNTVVYIEIKGEKKEGQIILVGKEPDTAKQAKMKNQCFWVCIVPGIPANPQLWVVEDPLSVGEYSIVTIDVSKWKSTGRRVV